MTTDKPNDNPKGYGTDLKADKPPEEMVLYEIVEPHICKITLNRPDRRNAILTLRWPIPSSLTWCGGRTRTTSFVSGTSGATKRP